MKFIQRLLSYLFFPAAIALILTLAALIPLVQTWVAQLVFDRKPELHASFESFTARFGHVEATDLHLEINGALFTVPSLNAGLPLTKAALSRSLPIRSLVAKGWTVDLTPLTAGKKDDASGTASSSSALAQSLGLPAAASASAAVRTFQGFLSTWKFPCDLSLDDVDLEGDVIVAEGAGKTPGKLHVKIKGSGLGVGHDGDFAVEVSGASIEPVFEMVEVAANGHVLVAMDTPRTLNHAAFKGDVRLKGGSPVRELAGLADLDVTRHASGEDYRFDFARGNDHVATAAAHLITATKDLRGTWKIAAQGTDLAPFVGEIPLPVLAINGEGDFATATDFATVHAQGQFHTSTSHLGVLAANLESLGALTVDTRFDLTANGSIFRVDHLNFSLAGDRPIATAQALQPFEWNRKTGALTVTKPQGDLMQGSLAGLPLAWFSKATATRGFTLTGGDVTGDFVVQSVKNGYTLQPKAPFTATGVAIERGGRILARGLDLSLALSADYTGEGWEMKVAPLTIIRAGKTLLTVAGKTSRLVGLATPTLITGTWTTDLQALAAQPAFSEQNWITARSASGDFSAKLEGTTIIDSKLSVAGSEEGESITATVHAEVGSTRLVTFNAPMKIAVPGGASDVSLEGTWWFTEKSGNKVNLRLGGKKVALDHLSELIAPAAALVGAPHPRNSATSDATLKAERDRLPFWGDATGHIAVSFDQLQIADSEFKSVRGNFEIEHGAVHLENGLYVLADNGLAQVSGSVSFTPAAEFPYMLKGAADGGEFDAAPLFGVPPQGEEAPFKGHFAITSTLSGQGINLEDLIARTQQEFRLKGTNGIIRLLKTSVSGASPEPSTPVSDTLGSVGATVGSMIFGLKKTQFQSGEIKLPKNTEAVLDFTYQVAEIGYKDLAITATRGSDHVIHVVDLTMNGTEERITGSGLINYVKGAAVAAEPIDMNLQFSFAGRAGVLLTNAGLLTGEKDADGFKKLEQPVHFGGTLQHLDQTQWHDLLAKAAAPKPDADKKTGKAAPEKKSPDKTN